MIPLSSSLRAFAHPVSPAAWIAALIAAVVSFLMTTAANDFPAAYHPDEPSKARQIIEGEFNFHHPMLMLTTVRLVSGALGTGDSIQEVTEAGRTVSAAFTAIAIFCLTMTAAVLYGNAAAIAAGLLLASNHHLFELAHYFKEDPAILAGITIFFLALTLFARRPSIAGVGFVGAGLGLAISGKYVGVLAAPFAIGMLIAHRQQCRLVPGLLVLAVTTLATFLLVNIPILLDLSGFLGGFEREIGFAIEGHKGITRKVPHGVYGAVFRESTNPVIWILLGVFAVGLLLRARSSRPIEWTLLAFPLIFAIVLSFSPKTHHRYFLPATGVILTLAASGIATLPTLGWNGQSLTRRIKPSVIVAVALAAALLVQAPRSYDYFVGFSNDSRSQLADYLRKHVPPGEILVQDKRAGLPSLALRNPIEGKLFAADVGTLDELRARGIRHIAVAEGDYGRFFRDKLRPTDSGFADFTRRRAFYDQLFAEGTLVLEIPSGTLLYLQPHLKLYRLD